MTWPFDNNTRTIEKKLAGRSFRADMTRNIIAVIAIALTTILFTGLFTLGAGMQESTQRANMILSGGDGHARIINLSQSEYDTIIQHPLIRESACSRKLADRVDNGALAKRDTQFWYYDDVAMKYMFVEPTGGHKPMAENEVIADTTTLELLGVPQQVGAAFTLELTVHGQKLTRELVLTGWWKSYPGVPYGTIIASPAYVAAHADELTDTYRQDQVDTGTITGILKFEDAHNVEADLQTVVTDCGFSTELTADNYVNAGVNPLYLSREDSNNLGTVLAMICVLLLFLFSGYLIIYNIFQISILRDLHFYGLLKTIGTTGRQINAIIRRQAWRLSAIGIPLGLCIGFLMGKALLPVLMAQTSFGDVGATVSPDPWIFLGAALFALITVRISTRKPAKLAAKVSAIEAVRYTDAAAAGGRKQKRASRGGRPQRTMARANLGRNKKRTVLVVLSLTLSIVLTNTVFNFSHSVDPENAIGNMIDFDFCIGQSRLLNYYEVNADSALTESFIQAVMSQPGFEAGGSEYGCKAAYKSDSTRQTVNRQEDGTFATHVYGLDEALLSRLKLVDGDMDAAKLASGAYVLEGVYVNTRGVMDADSMNHAVGDTVWLDHNGSTREFTVLGHVVANEANTYDWVGSCFFLPRDVYTAFTGNTYVMSYKFDVAQGSAAAMDLFLEQYTGSVEPSMTYKSRSTIMAGTADIQKIVVSVGGSIAMIIGLIGLLNFANTILTSIFTRRRELAILQSIGMTGKQVMEMLCLEGCNYAVLSAAMAIPLCMASAWLFVRPLCRKIWFLNFKMNFWPLVIIFPLLLLMGVAIPYMTYRIMNRQSVVERIKGGE